MRGELRRRLEQAGQQRRLGERSARAPTCRSRTARRPRHRRRRRRDRRGRGRASGFRACVKRDSSRKARKASLILRCSERSAERNRFLASCWVMRRAALHHLVGTRVFDQGAGRANEVDAEVLEEAPVLGGQRRLDQVIGQLFERHGVVVQNAALADLVAVAVEKLTLYLPVGMRSRRTPSAPGWRARRGRASRRRPASAPPRQPRSRGASSRSAEAGKEAW